MCTLSTPPRLPSITNFPSMLTKARSKPLSMIVFFFYTYDHLTNSTTTPNLHGTLKHPQTTLLSTLEHYTHHPLVMQIVDAIESSKVTLVEGGTGTGKSTQVAQFIYDHHFRHNKYCNVVVTQPRKIAAISLAHRVCSENGWDVGTVCGYQVCAFFQTLLLNSLLCCSMLLNCYLILFEIELHVISQLSHVSL